MDWLNMLSENLCSCFLLVPTSSGDVLSVVYPDSSTATQSAVSEKDEG